MGKKKATVEPGFHDVIVDIDEDKWPIRTYGRWDLSRSPKNGKYFVPALLSGSDYSGQLVHRSNYEVWKEKFASGEDKWWCDVSGGHGTYAIVISLERVPEEDEEEAGEILGALEQYPLIDEDHHSHLEMESQEEAWKDWGAERLPARSRKEV